MRRAGRSRTRSRSRLEMSLLLTRPPISQDVFISVPGTPSFAARSPRPNCSASQTDTVPSVEANHLAWSSGNVPQMQQHSSRHLYRSRVVRSCDRPQRQMPPRRSGDPSPHELAPTAVASPMSRAEVPSGHSGSESELLPANCVRARSRDRYTARQWLRKTDHAAKSGPLNPSPDFPDCGRSNYGPPAHRQRGLCKRRSSRSRVALAHLIRRLHDRWH